MVEIVQRTVTARSILFTVLSTLMLVARNKTIQLTYTFAYTRTYLKLHSTFVHAFENGSDLGFLILVVGNLSD